MHPIYSADKLDTCTDSAVCLSCRRVNLELDLAINDRPLDPAWSADVTLEANMPVWATLKINLLCQISDDPLGTQTFQLGALVARTHSQDPSAGCHARLDTGRRVLKDDTYTDQPLST